MRIGLSSLIGDGFGSGNFVFGEVPSGGGGGYPPYGTFLELAYAVTYPIVNGGSFVDVPYPAPLTSYENQNADVNKLADGAGGFFYDWSSATNVVYKPSQVLIITDASSGELPPLITPAGNFTYFSWDNIDYVHSGYGSYIPLYSGGNQAQYGDFIGFVQDPHEVGSIEVPAGSGTYRTNGTYEGFNLFYDGNISWYSEDGGNFAYFAYGFLYDTTPVIIEVPTGSGVFYENGRLLEFIADGNGGFTYNETGNFIPTGTFYYTSYGTLTINGTDYPTGLYTNWYANGNGSYEFGNGGSLHPNGTLIFYNIVSNQGTQVEVPSGSANYFWDSFYGDKYFWDGTGSYYYLTGTFSYGYGEYITYDGYNTYYWDGNGSYFSD